MDTRFRALPVRYYDRRRRRLVYLGQRATASFWDDHWGAEVPAEAIRRIDKFVVRWTRRYVPAGGSVVEGGCGFGRNVYSLQQAGYRACGVDYARRTVGMVKRHAPELKMLLGDVRGMPFRERSFDGYWSLGVIEHFYEGFSRIAGEMARVLRPGGHLFLSFPHMSPLRRIGARLGRYPDLPPASGGGSSSFYQFALRREDVADSLGAAGFRLVRQTSLAGLKGLKDEAGALKPILQRLFDGRCIAARGLQVVAEPVLRSWCGHSAFLVLRKE